MPSDPSGTHPKGVLVKPAADFFDDNLAVAGDEFVQINPTPTYTWQAYALYNNGNAGQVFKVYGITAFGEGGGGFGFFFQYGIVGTASAPASSLRPDIGNPYGQMYRQTQTGSASITNPYLTSAPIGAIAAPGFDSGTTISHFPLFIIPRGYSLVGAPISSTIISGVWFWYQVANE